MENLCEGLDRLSAENGTFKMLMSLARAHDPYIPSASTSRASYQESLKTIAEHERPAWTRFFLDDEPKSFYAIFAELTLPEEDLHNCWAGLSSWLRSVLYQTSIFLANIVPETAHNMALGHPIAIWLYEYVDVLDAACSVGMAIWRKLMSKSAKLPPPALIRLPQLVIRFRTILLPVINGFHEESWKEMGELRSEYAKNE